MGVGITGEKGKGNESIRKVGGLEVGSLGRSGMWLCCPGGTEVPLCADPGTAFPIAPALLSKRTSPCLSDLPSCWLPPDTAVKVYLLCRRFWGGYISHCLPGLLQELSPPEYTFSPSRTQRKQ